MKKLCAMLTGGFLAFLLAVCFDAYMDQRIEMNKEAVRNHRSYERFGSSEVQKLIMDDHTLPVFGSSELMPISDYRQDISSFLNGEDMNIVTIGAGYYQSLNHTMELGAISEGIRSGKVALFLSPQWFDTKGLPSEAFPPRFSEDQLLEFLRNRKVSDDNKKYVLDRTLDLLSGSPTQRARVEKYKKGFESPVSAERIYTKIMGAFWRERQKYETYKQLDEMYTEIPREDLANIDYSEMLNLAEEQGEKACTNNEFGIYDEYWTKYVKEVYDKGSVKTSQQVFTESVEYADLQCFLSVAKELGIEVILVSIPVHEKWYEYQGLKSDIYYDNIRKIANEYENVILLDMTEYGDEKYFFKDVMHLGWKGWTRVNEALYKEFKKK